MAQRAINDLEEKSSIEDKLPIFPKNSGKDPGKRRIGFDIWVVLAADAFFFAFFREIWVLAVNILLLFGLIREIWGLAVIILIHFSFILEKQLHR